VSELSQLRHDVPMADEDPSAARDASEGAGPASDPEPSSPHRGIRDANDDPRPSADDRDRTAEDRDQISEAHDAAAQSRDERADTRDRRAERREEATSFDAAAASDRAGAWRDRRGGANDRMHAADDRAAASIDRLLASRERAASSIDELTGAYRRDPGIVELAREVARAKRTRRPFVLAFADVDGLKATNGSLGHAAGDQLLCRVVDTMRSHLRSYDLVVRYGGDEFLCALLDVGIDSAAERVVHISADLATYPAASISTGLAELRPQDSLEELIARADAALRAQRRRRAARPADL
jgi:diguanylate cyclase (GGDEF)-like protein